MDKMQTELEREGSSSSSPDSPVAISPSSLPAQELAPEVSMVEASEVTGVKFTPELWMQRRAWALEVLRKENARSVLDVGCGPGALLETLVIPPTTITEPPILSRRRPSMSKSHERQQSHRSNSGDKGEIDEDEGGPQELFLSRLGGLDTSPSILSSALSLLSPPQSPNHTSSFSASGTDTKTTTGGPVHVSTTPNVSATTSASIVPFIPGTTPRWEPLITELYLGGIEKYNAKLEDYDAIVMLEVIEHLEPSILNRFGVVTLGTYRPRLLLVTTPNFDFNAKFPRAKEEGFARKGFVDPTGRTERLFRHSDHKVEMTSEEFRSWAEASAADWGYSVEISGVGISSIPSYYPPKDPNDPTEKRRPIYATQTAVFRLASGLPTRSPRSVRSVELPFMPSSKESMHPHKIVGRFLHPASAPGLKPYPVFDPSASEGTMTSADSKKAFKARLKAVEVENRTPESASSVRLKVESLFKGWNVGKVSLDEVWGVEEICGACRGSKRYLVGCLGGYGDCEAIDGASSSSVQLAETSTMTTSTSPTMTTTTTPSTTTVTPSSSSTPSSSTATPNNDGPRSNDAFGNDSSSRSGLKAAVGSWLNSAKNVVTGKDSNIDQSNPSNSSRDVSTTVETEAEMNEGRGGMFKIVKEDGAGTGLAVGYLGFQPGASNLTGHVGKEEDVENWGDMKDLNLGSSTLNSTEGRQIGGW